MPKEDHHPMGVFSRIERRLEQGVGSAFARLFKGKVHPAEIARALQQDADDNATKIGKGRTLVPNRYTVRLGDTDYNHLKEWERQLTRSLAEICREHFGDEGYSTYGAVKVEFVHDESMRTGIFTVESRVDDAEPSVPLRAHLPPSGAPPITPPRRDDRPKVSAAPPIPAPPAPAPPAMPVPPARQQAPRPAPLRYHHMIVIDGPNARVLLHPGRNIIGRGSAADIRISDTGISRQHAEIHTDGVLATVIDLNSTNGTMVNGRRITRAALRHGDVIRLGRSVLVYRYEPEGAT